VARRPRRLTISSDDHKLIGRIYDLSIAGLHFDDYADAEKYPDVIYALTVNNRASLLTKRIESLNHVGDILWPRRRIRPKLLPMSAYEYCNFIQDVLLMRTISILDCCCLLTVAILELDIIPRQTTIDRIRNASNSHPSSDKLKAISDLQFEFRTERNMRFHRAEEEPLTDDDVTFKIAALYAFQGQGITGNDRHDRNIDLTKSYDEAIDNIRNKFRNNIKLLKRPINELYDCLIGEFNTRFSTKFRDPSGYGHKIGMVKI